MERGVQYARERLFKGGDFQGLPHLWSEAQRWCRDVAGLRIHGTTHGKPLLVFQNEERQVLIPWDGEPYEIADWRNAKVHQDHHVQCRQALYSVPSALCPPGQKVEIRGSTASWCTFITLRQAQGGRLIKTHLRQPRGGRSTDPEDYPVHLSAYTTRAPDRIQAPARPSWGRRWTSSPSASSTVPFPGSR